MPLASINFELHHQRRSSVGVERTRPIWEPAELFMKNVQHETPKHGGVDNGKVDLVSESIFKNNL